ncbi:MAG: flagellar basal body P-ring formation chaperone FlgA [Planctomycetota bacterium]
MILALTLLGALLFEDEPRQPDVTVVMQSTVTVAGLDFRVGDVAQLRGAQADRVEEASKVKLGLSPQPGFKRLLRASEIRTALEAAGFQEDQIRFAGPAETVVVVESQTISADEIQEKGLKFLEQELAVFASQDVERRIELARAPIDVSVPVARDEMQLEFRWPGLPKTRGDVTIQLVVMVDGQRVRTVPVRYFIRVFQDVFVAKRPLTRGDRLGAGGIGLERQEITGLFGTPVSTQNEPSDLEMIRDALPGSVLTRTNTRPAILVNARSIVTVRHQQGTLLITATGRAMESGAKGDVIRIQNLRSDRIVTARVVGPNATETVN